MRVTQVHGANVFDASGIDSVVAPPEADAAVASRLTELLDPVDHAIVQDFFREALEGKTVSFEHSFTLDQGRKVRFAVKLVPGSSQNDKGVFMFWQAATAKAASSP